MYTVELCSKLFTKDIPQTDSFTNANHTSAVKQTYVWASNIGENFPFLWHFPGQ